MSKAVLFSVEHNVELAVVGGGHSTGGSSSTDGGLCIDLSKMRKVSVNNNEKTVTAAGGALWEDVDLEAAKYDLAAVGGTVNHTGVGGLTLGGGYGYLSPKYGMAIDNLLSVEYVLADGKIVTASENENVDLFWAIKGAGASFGVATSFTFRAHEQKNTVWGGMLIWSPAQLKDVIAFANTVIGDKSGNALMLLGFGAPPPAHVPTILSAVFYNGSEEEAKKFYGPLISIGPLLNMTSVMPYVAANTMLNPTMVHGLRRTTKGSAFMAPLDLEFALEIFADFEAFLKQVPDAIHTIILWEFIPFSKILEIPNTAAAFANRGAYGNLLFGPGGWTDPAKDLVGREWARVMATKSKVELERKKSKGTDVVTSSAVGEYANYDSKYFNFVRNNAC